MNSTYLSHTRRPAETCIALLILVGCPASDDSPVDETGTATTETEATGDGDGDPTGDGDGDPTGDGDGDGDPTGDGDGDCMQEGCDCDPALEDPCDPGLYCDEADSLCTAPACGNDEIEPLEQCEDGNDVDGDGCDNDCTFTEILFVDASYQNTCALIEGGRVRCWGLNSNGQLGYGHTDSIGDDETPADAGDLMLPEPGVELTMGDQHSCILMADMNVRCWGIGSSGQLGYGATENIGDDEFPNSITDVMIGGAVLEVDAGGAHTCARLDVGKIRCWGSGGSGQLGYGNNMSIGDDELPESAGDVPIGGAVIAQATGFSHTCAILANGKVRCWGSGFSGQLGYGDTMGVGVSNTPQQAGDAPVVPMGLDPNTKATAVALGWNTSCALFETGDVMCWGSGFNGWNGQGTTDNVGDDELPSSLPPIQLPAPAIAITPGDRHVCALLEGGEALCWGSNSGGQLGIILDENVGDDELPISIDPLLFDGPISQLDAGGNHTCAILAETNEVYCWGENFYGQLGYGHTDNIGDDESLISAGPVQMF